MENQEIKFLDSFKNRWKKKFETKNQIEYVVEGIVTITFNLVFFWLINNYYDRVSFFTSDFPDLLAIINISIIVNTLTGVGLIITRNQLYKLVDDIINNLFAVAVFIATLVIFPIDFTGQWDVLDTVLKVFAVVFSVILTFAVLGNITTIANHLLERNK